MLKQLLTTILGILLFTSNCLAAEENLIKAKLLTQTASPDVNGKQDVTVGVNLKILEGWHIYWENSGEAGSPTKVAWDLPKDSNIGPLRWPAPERFAERGNITTFGYTKEVTLLADASVPTGSSIRAEVRWLVCKDICIPGSALVETSQFSANEPLIKDAEKTIPTLTSPLVKQVQSLRNSVGSYVILELDLNALRNMEKLSEKLQVFTYSDLTYSFAEVSANGWIRVPITKKDLGTKALSGILVFSKELTSKDTDSSVQWSVEPKFDFLTNEIEKLDFTKLSFRTHGTKKTLSTEVNASPSLPFALVLLYAFIGGLILNLMPCVLPVISIKVLGFIENSEKSKAEARRSAIGFSSGIICCFMLLAFVVTILRQAGKSVGWGFQFHHPEFVFGLIIVVFILALGFFDVYTIGVGILSKSGRKVDKLSSGFLKDFLDGALATALSTPCSAPFLGVSLIVAFSQSTAKTFLIFFFIGLGLALPYAYLSTNPRLTNLLPKPGNWMHRIRHLMGFCLIGTLIWLLFVLENLQNHAAFWTLAVLLTIYILFWLRSWQRESNKKIPFALSYLFCLFAFIIFIPNIIISLDNTEKIDWQPYSPELVKQLANQGKSVFIDFTADWCVTCKANEIYTISSSAVKKSIKDSKIIPLKADWTKADPQITDALTGYGAKGVPLYVVISALEPDRPKVLPTLITPSILIEAFESTSIR